MTTATWALVIVGLVSASGGVAALARWVPRLRPGRTRRELGQLRRQHELLRTALWMLTSAHGERWEVNRKVRDMLMLDGWTPDEDLRAEVGDYSLSRLRDRVPGVTE